MKEREKARLSHRFLIRKHTKKKYVCMLCNMQNRQNINHYYNYYFYCEWADFYFVNF
jgi:hypothetical protein